MSQNFHLGPSFYFIRKKKRKRIRVADFLTDFHTDSLVGGESFGVTQASDPTRSIVVIWIFFFSN